MLVASTSIFVANEIVTHIRIPRMASKMGEEGKRVFRSRKNYFVPSLVLGGAAAGIFMFLLLYELLVGFP